MYVITCRPALILLVAGLLTATLLGNMGTLNWTEVLLELQKLNLIRFLALLLLLKLVNNLSLRDMQAVHACVISAVMLTLSLIVAFLGAKLYILTCLGFVLLGVWYFAKIRADAWPTLIVGGALLVNLVLAPVVFNLLSEQILQLDAWLVYGFAHWLDPDTVLRGTSIQRSSGFSVVLVGACSAFNALSLAMLSYVTWVVFLRGVPNRRDLLWLLPMTAAIVAWNVFRISLMGESREGYAYWHESSTGALWISAGQHAVLVSSAWLGERLCRR